MKLISFNVNGVRACSKKTLIQDLTAIDADMVCLKKRKQQKNKLQKLYQR